MARYRWAANGATYGPSQGLVKTLAKLSAVCKRDGSLFRFKPPGGEYSKRYKGRVLFLAHAGRELAKLEIGELAKAATACSSETLLGHVYLVRRVKPEPKQGRTPDGKHRTLYMYTGAPVNLAAGNPRIAKIAQAAADQFPAAKCSGYAYTKKVVGTTVWSQHSKFPPNPGFGNAIDLTIYKGITNSADMDAMRPMALWIVAQAKLGNLPVDKVIFGNQQWQRDNGYNASFYSGEFHYHVHTQATPYQTGTPVDA